jgi:hypothetical protein
MLTDEQIRNGIIDPALRWPNKEVPFVIDDVFSEYYNTKIQIGNAGRGGKYPRIMTTALEPVHTGGSVDEVMAITTYPCL